MSTTKQTAPVGSWLKVADKKENVIISHDWTAPVHVYVAAAAPDANSAYHFCRATVPFSMGGIPGVDVYIRSGGSTTLDVTVTAV